MNNKCILRRLRQSVNDLQLPSKLKKLARTKRSRYQVHDKDEKKALLPRARKEPIPASAFSRECNALCRLFDEHMHIIDDEDDGSPTSSLSQDHFRDFDYECTIRADNQSDASSMLTAYTPSSQPPRQRLYQNDEALRLLEGRTENTIQRAPSLLSISSQSLAWAGQNADIVRSLIIQKGLAVTIESSSMQFAEMDWSEDEVASFRLYVQAADGDHLMD